MATLEKRGKSYRIVFWIAGERFSRSLKTKSEREAFAAQVRLEDNLRRFELGLLPAPEGADLATFLPTAGARRSQNGRPFAISGISSMPTSGPSPRAPWNRRRSRACGFTSSI